MDWLRAVVALMMSISGGVSATAPAVRVSLPPTTTAATAPDGLRCGQWFGAAVAAGWTPDEVPQLDRIIWRESHCQADATRVNANGSIDRGLTQINSINLGWLADVGIGPDDLLIGPRNLEAARLLYDQHGWSPWRPLP